MSKDPQIGWQKYEDMLESQLNSPIMMNIYNNFTEQMISSLTDEELESLHEMGEIPDAPEAFVPILSTIPLQLLSYYIAVQRDCNVDQPRNLAKSVTVE